MTDETKQTSNVVALKTPKKAKSCPLCRKLAVQTYSPFCSKRCADLDLGKWLGEGYRIPSQEHPGLGDGLEEED